MSPSAAPTGGPAFGGAGLPLVLLHGFMGGPSCWRGMLEAARLEAAAGETVAAPGPEILCPAILGHGEAAAEVRSFEDEVDRLAAVIRSRASGSVHLLGYSMGGRLALGLASRHPALIASLLLIGAHPGLEDPAARRARAALDEARAEALEREGIEAFVRAWERLPLFATQAALAGSGGALEARLRAQRARRLAHDPVALARSLRLLGLGKMPCWLDALASRPPPIRALVGALDERFVALAERLRERLGAQVIALPGAGHNLLLERAEALAPLLLEWIGAPSSRLPAGARR
ncbi:MAG: alpha/beta fold hydrolase [Myxococcales bacterium]|nr:alpha/beta fold hydrolase [Myxococcales bacterium]